MEKRTKELIKSGIILSIIILMFIAASYITQRYFEQIKSIIGGGVIGMVIYVLLNIIEVIIVPVNLLPIIAIASNLWGGFIAAILTIIGWSIGAIIAFMLARKYGIDLVKKFVPIEKINKIEKRISSEHIFWSLVILRIVLPSDIVSYALGLFSKIKERDYILATIMGFTPLAFFLAYLGTLPVKYQIIGFIVIGIILIIGFYINPKRKE